MIYLTDKPQESNLNRSRFKYVILIPLLLIFISPSFSEGDSTTNSSKFLQEGFFSGIDYSLGTGLSYLNGQYREIVYPDTNSVNQYLSELIWNLDNVFLLNLTAEAKKGPWTLNLSMETAVTTETGEMTDTDWLNYFSTDNTHWSLSRIWLDNSFLLNTGLTYSFNLFDNLKIPIGLGYQLNFWDWEDEILDYDYPFIPNPDIIGENGIDYKIIQNIFYASVGGLFTMGNITTGLNIALSPFIYAWSLDHHIIRPYAPYFFMDSFYANFWYRTELTINIQMRSNEGLVFTLFMEELPESVGDTYYFDKDPFNPEEIGVQTGYYPNGAGHASVLWGTSLSYTWTF